MDKINHIAITVTNIKQATNWYTKNFDCKVKEKYDNWVLPNRAIQEQKVSDAITRAEIIEWNVYRQMLSTPSRFKDVFYFTTEIFNIFFRN